MVEFASIISARPAEHYAGKRPDADDDHLARTNIERFHRLLQTCCDEAQRTTLEQLLA
jgi:hypothetical protein